MIASNSKQNANGQRGIALLFALLTLLVLSVLAAALLFTVQAGTWSSSSYQKMLQARYVAEAGAQNTLNYLLYTYTPPASMAGYDLTKYPVQDSASHSTVILSAMTGVTANYPTSSVQTAFNSALNNASVPGLGVAASYDVTAKLLRMQPAVGFLGTGQALQTWEITSLGNVPGIRNAQVQVVMRIERRGSPLSRYGVAGTGTTCPDVNFTGGTMDAWNSEAGTYAGTHQNSGGDIGTNGNVTLSGGSTRVYGTISDSSNITVGNCPNGITNNVGGTPWNGLQLLSQPLVYAPPPPSPMTPTTNLNVNSNTCWSGLPAGCTVIAGPGVSIVPGTYGDITSNSNVHVTAGTYYINSLSLNGGSITLDSYPVIINLGGNGVSSGGTLFTSNSSTTINDGALPSNLQIVTACCKTGSPPVPMANPPVITMNSSSAMYAVVYAPNSYVHITGSSQFLGAVVGQKVTSDSSGGFHYDLALQNNLLMPGVYYPYSFSWSKF